MSSRRDFIKRSSLCAAGALIIPTAFSCKQKKPSHVNGLINVACIGLGGHGVHNLKKYLKLNKMCRVVAVCDVYLPLAEKAKKMVDEAYGNSDCIVYQDFREVLARPEIDAIQCTTPDHWHVPMSIIALNSGKHVSCEKPFHTIEEGRMLVNVAKKSDRVFGVSVEDRFLPVYQQMVQLVKAGRIGELQKIYIELPVRKVPVTGMEIVKPPNGFDYDLWCGPAPKHPYSQARCFYNFRWNYDYAGGSLTDWLPHQGETAQWMIGDDKLVPQTIEPVKPTVFHKGIFNTAKEFDIMYTYENGVQMEVKNGIPWIRAIGSEGWIESKGWNKPLTASQENLLDLPEKPMKVPHRKGEHYDFLNAIKEGRQTIMNAELGQRTSTMCNVGNIAAQLNRKVVWDSQNEKFIDDTEANALCTKTPRTDWSYDKIMKMKC